MTGTRDRFVHYRLGAAGGPRLLRPFTWLLGVIATGVAVTLGAVLAVLTAAAVAVLALIAGVTMLFTGMALRARRTVRARAAADGVIDARKVGDTWVTYGWDRQGR
ncbi:MAG TPA: hypothetical protein VGN74_00480 [Brevundimonas sp.]|jgi:hypothetical protein|uniref:hypothetical protein n=1 Tax=Brevundimonas sp. TaxID=1871086 RepID=UPI002E0D3B46|nr:hypothetical protein [Brevundimonas sp.]